MQPGWQYFFNVSLKKQKQKKLLNGNVQISIIV